MMPKLFLAQDLQRELGEVITKLEALRKRMIKSEAAIERQRTRIENLGRRVSAQNARVAAWRSQQQARESDG